MNKSFISRALSILVIIVLLISLSVPVFAAQFSPQDFPGLIELVSSLEWCDYAVFRSEDTYILVGAISTFDFLNYRGAPAINSSFFEYSDDEWVHVSGQYFFAYESYDCVYSSCRLVDHRGIVLYDPDSVFSSSSLLADFSAVSVSFLGVCRDIADVIVSNPLLLITIGFFFLGACIVILRRIIDKN